MSRAAPSLSPAITRKLRLEAGRWLRCLRERRGLSQRGLADRVGLEYHTIVSQLENGRGRIAPEDYLTWAHALDVDPRNFVTHLMSYYDPVTYDIIFGLGGIPHPASEKAPA